MVTKQAEKRKTNAIKHKAIVQKLRDEGWTSQEIRTHLSMMNRAVNSDQVCARQVAVRQQHPESPQRHLLRYGGAADAVSNRSSPISRSPAQR